ncbi:MAG: tyrosine-type recombinase/integrase [bacterium]|nr:tyrosine-type recombinase/integrase [bacterium]
MSDELIPFQGAGTPQVKGQSLVLPTLIERAGDQASKRFLDFFAATIRNANTREAYARAVAQFFRWAELHGLQQLTDLEPFMVGAYIEQLGTTGLPEDLALMGWNGRGRPPFVDKAYSPASIKQSLAAIRKLFDWLVTGQVLAVNPAAPVKGPRHSVTVGLTPVLTVDEAKALIEAIDTSTAAGIRDRALIGVLVYSFARISATVNMRFEDYYYEKKFWWFRLHEKGGKMHSVPAHHKAYEYMEDYLDAADIRGQKGAPLFRSVDRYRRFTELPLSRNDALKMVKRRAKNAGIEPSLAEKLCNHSFRATGITNFIENGGSVEKAQQIAAHADVRTTKLYDRSNDELTLDEIERIKI